MPQPLAKGVKENHAGETTVRIANLRMQSKCATHLNAMFGPLVHSTVDLYLQCISVTKKGGSKILRTDLKERVYKCQTNPYLLNSSLFNAFFLAFLYSV